jgi:hypothetical protein
MAFIAENGSGVPGANSYAEAADADDYFADRGVAAWLGSSTVKEQALIRATDYVDKTNARAWRGLRSGTTQGLSWPRMGAVDDDGFDIVGLPPKLQEAVFEYALRALTADLLPDPTDGPDVIVKRSKVGPIEEETHYSGGATQIKPYPAADELLRGLKRRGGRAVRA